MKVTLEFDDKPEALIALRGLDMYCSLFDIRELIFRDRKDDVAAEVTIDKIMKIAYTAIDWHK